MTDSECSHSSRVQVRTSLVRVVAILALLVTGLSAQASLPGGGLRESFERVFRGGAAPEIEEGLVLGAILESKSDLGNKSTNERSRWAGRWIESLQNARREGATPWPTHQLAKLTQNAEPWTVEVRYLGTAGLSANSSSGSDDMALGESSASNAEDQRVEVIWRARDEVRHRETLSLSWGVTGEVSYRPSGGDPMRAFVKLVRVRYPKPKAVPNS